MRRVGPTRDGWGHQLHSRYRRPWVAKVGSLFDDFIEFEDSETIEKAEARFDRGRVAPIPRADARHSERPLAPGERKVV
jgi:hypothetical protein